MAKFNERFRELRQSAGLSQADLSKLIHITKSSINMYERGEREPGIDKLEVIADFFNVDMDYLTGKSEHKNKYAWLIDAVSNNGKDVDLTLVAYRIRSEQGISPDEAMEKAKQIAKSYSESSFTDPRLQRLTDNYNRMNDTGKGKLVAYSDDLAANPANTETSHIYKIAARDGGVKEVELSDDQIKEMMDAPDWSDEI